MEEMFLFLVQKRQLDFINHTPKFGCVVLRKLIEFEQQEKDLSWVPFARAHIEQYLKYNICNVNEDTEEEMDENSDDDDDGNSDFVSVVTGDNNSTKDELLAFELLHI